MATFTQACSVFGCGHKKPCPLHARRRLQAKTDDRGYDWKWRSVSRAHLRAFPFCGDRPTEAPPTTDSQCQREGVVTYATVTDHIRPHRGDKFLMWARANRQSLCSRCHGIKSRNERGAA